MVLDHRYGKRIAGVLCLPSIIWPKKDKKMLSIHDNVYPFCPLTIQGEGEEPTKSLKN